jgi:hypothetical protein
MKYILSERQYNFILENNKTDIFYLNVEALDNRWDIIVKVLKKRGFPKWRTDGNLLLTDEEITSLHNLVEANKLDIYYTNIKDLGYLKKVNKLSFDPDLIEDLGDLTEVKSFTEFEMLQKAISLGFNNGSYGNEINIIGVSQVFDLITISHKSDLSFFRNFFKGVNEYDYIYGNDIIKDIVEYYLNHENEAKIEEILGDYEEFDDKLTLYQNIIKISDSGIIDTLLESYNLCAEQSFRSHIMESIESALNEVVDVKSHSYDAKGNLLFEVNFNYDYIMKYFIDETKFHKIWNGNMYDSIMEYFSYDLTDEKPLIEIDENWTPQIKKDCINYYIKESL